MDELEQLKKKLEQLKAELKLLTDKAATAVQAEELETAKEANDKADGIKAHITECKRAIEALEAQEQERAEELERKAQEQAAELERKAMEKAKEMVKGLGLDRPDYTASEAAAAGAPAQVSRNLQRIMVMSPYDNFGTLDLALKYHLLGRAAQAGLTNPPSERFFRALAVRANEFMKEEDVIPVIGPRGEVKAVKVPAFDPRVVQPWGRDVESVSVGGQQVPHTDNVTQAGIKSLYDLAVKADDLVYSTQSSYGSDWVPTLMAAAIWRTIRLEARVLGLFDQFDMPSNPYDYPRESTDPTVYGVNETTDENQLVIGANMPITDSKIGTAKVTFSAGKIGAITFWSEEMNEDSIIAVEPQYRDQFGVKMAHAIDELLISGDETTATLNISYYGASITSASRFLKVNGIRHEALVTTTADSRDGGALTVDDWNTTRALMGTNGVYGADPSQMVCLCDIPTGYKFEDLDEVLTVDKFGPQATVLRGQLGNLKGVPIVKSEDYSLTDTSGHIHSTANSNSKGSFCLVNRRGVKVGWKRRPRILVGQVPFSDAWYILGLTRLDIGFFGAGMVAMSYNITV